MKTGMISSSKHILILIRITLIVIALIFGFLTYQRNLVWKDEISLWSDVVKKSPKKSRAYMNLGKAYAVAGDDREALKYFGIALQLDPGNFKIYSNMGVSYNRIGMKKQAINYYKTAIRLNPGYALGRYNLGLLLFDSGDYKGAYSELSNFVMLAPNSINTQIAYSILNEMNKKGNAK
jgi:tetratricopeptide (TPR) repeat protein